MYEVFCAEHPGALEIVKSLQHKRPVEWDTFERHCTTLIAANLAHADGSAQGHNGVVEEEEEASRSREQHMDADFLKEGGPSHLLQHPTSSSDDHPPLLRGHPGSNHDLRPAAGTVGKNARKDKPTERDPRLRLQFTDYLIKPVQRICKYPLLLGALTYERRPQAPTEADAVIMTAKQSMMDVAALVDNANLSHYQLQQTSRISTRLSAPAAVLTFIRTLSTCVLVGSLDVVRAPTLKAKYLAAFLYDGGFLALAKVNRGPRYELRYWFSLEGFEVNDANNDDRESESPKRTQGTEGCLQRCCHIPFDFAITATILRSQRLANAKSKYGWMHYVPASRRHQLGHQALHHRTSSVQLLPRRLFRWWTIKVHHSLQYSPFPKSKVSTNKHPRLHSSRHKDLHRGRALNYHLCVVFQSHHQADGSQPRP